MVVRRKLTLEHAALTLCIYKQSDKMQIAERLYRVA